MQRMRYCKFTQKLVMVSDSEWQGTDPGITALMHRSRTGRTVRITVICHDARLSGSNLEDRVPDQKSKPDQKLKQESKIDYSVT